MGGVSKYAKISTTVEKCEIWNIKSWHVPLTVARSADDDMFW